MSTRIVLIQALDRNLTKVISPTKTASYDKASRFHHHTVEIADIDAFHQVLLENHVRTDTAFVTGQVREGAATIINRRFKPKNGEAPPDLCDGGVQILDIDVDSLPLTAGINPTNALLVGTNILKDLERVWPGISKVSCVVQLSASAGLPGKEHIAKCHVYVMLSQHHPHEHVRHVLRQLNEEYEKQSGHPKLFDPQVVVPTQPHYIAKPVFIEGAQDPCTDRITFIRGKQEVASLPPLIAAEPRIKIKSSGNKSKSNKPSIRVSHSGKTIDELKAELGPGNRYSTVFALIRSLYRLQYRSYGSYADQYEYSIINEVKDAVVAQDPLYSGQYLDNGYLEGVFRYVGNGHNPSDSDADEAFKAHHISRTTNQYIDPIPMESGVDLLRAGMGSGKTFQISRLAGEYKKHGKSVLVIVHRQSLAHEVSRRMGIPCYLDMPSWKVAQAESIVICINSLHKLGEQRFDLVVIEESDQLLRSLSDLKQKGRVCRARFQLAVNKATQVVCADAQLSAITVGALEQLRPSGQFRVLMHTANAHPKHLRVHETRGEVISEIFKAQDKGEQVLVMTNSAREAGAVYESLNFRYPEKRGILITSKTSADEAVVNLLRHFDKEGMTYDFVVASPSISTGVSIEKLPLKVFGLFGSNVNCHTDVLQAIHRVRHATEIDVWLAKSGDRIVKISPEEIRQARFDAMKELDELTANLGGGYLQPADPWLSSLWDSVFRFETHSKAELRIEFLNECRRLGYSAEFPEKDDDAATRGNALRREGLTLDEARLNQGLVSAPDISAEKASELESAFQLSSPNKIALEKYRIKAFYGREVNLELVSQDRRGKWRREILRAELVTGDLTNPILAEFNQLQNGVEPEHYRAKIKERELLRLVLGDLGFDCDHHLQHTGQPWTARTIQVSGLDREIWQRRVEFKAHAGASVPRDFQTNPLPLIGRILKSCGIKVTSKKRGAAGNGGREYLPDPLALEFLQNELKSRRARGDVGGLLATDIAEG
ncbi:MAG: hypothetical protein PHE55_09995 [Methylococcaceae bacterium]|nr:hypothetical protein [Methylococcaceae bacterium]